MARRDNPQDPNVRINLVLPVSERDAFDRWCRYGAKPRISMTKRLRQLIAADVAGKLHVARVETKPKKK